MEETGVNNPVFKLIENKNNLNNLDFGDTTGMKNPLLMHMNPGIIQNNNFNNAGINPMNFPNFNIEFNDNNLDNNLDELNMVIQNLKTDIDKVMMGINRLNFIIENIKMNRHSNLNNMNMLNNGNMNMNNNMLLFNNINKNMMNINNMNISMNSKINNDMINNDFKMNMNNLMYNNSNKIFDTNNEEFNVIFRKEGVITRFKCKSDEKVSNIIDRYREKSLDDDNKIKFFFNAKELNKNLTLSEAGITNNSNIFVITLKKP